MALTSIEAIAEKLQEERKNRLEEILISSGSQAIVKNDYGITIVDEKNVASSLVFKELNKDKYDEEEIKKAIDIEVKELKPSIPTPNLDLVPRPIYDKEVTLNEDLRIKLADVTAKYSASLNEIKRLQTEVTKVNIEKLSISQKDDLISNQLETVSDSLATFTEQIQVAVQKSVEESILRTSLQSQNTGYKVQIEALIKQIDSLNSIIEGLQAQLGAVQQQQAIQQGTQAQAMASGADIINEVCIVKIKDKADAAKSKVWAKINANGGNKWTNGDYIDFTNNDKNPIIINITFTPIQNMAIIGAEQTMITLPAGEQKQIKLTINEKPAGGRGGVDSRKKFIGWSGTSDYKGGTMKIEVKKSDGTSKDKKYDTGFTKTHPDSF
jgi:hypothetical protein